MSSTSTEFSRTTGGWRPEIGTNKIAYLSERWFTDAPWFDLRIAPAAGSPIIDGEGSDAMASVKTSKVNPKYKRKYRVTNWAAYERGLRDRGDVTVWLSEEAIKAWEELHNRLGEMRMRIKHSTMVRPRRGLLLPVAHPEKTVALRPAALQFRTSCAIKTGDRLKHPPKGPLRSIPLQAGLARANEVRSRAPRRGEPRAY